MTYEGYKLARNVITSVGQFCLRMFAPFIVLLVFPVSVVHCCLIYDGLYGPDENVMAAFFIYLNISGKSFSFRPVRYTYCSKYF